jgi:flagellar biosynthesis protein FlhG
MKSIAIANGKGGVGKTSLSASLAISLREHGHSVLLVDLDLGLANLDLILGLKPETTLRQVVRDGTGISEAIVCGPEGVDVVTGGSGVKELACLEKAQLEALAESVRSAGSKYDFLVLDTASGVGENVMVFLARSDRVLIVATPDPTSIIDAFATAKILFGERPDADVSLVVNMAESETHGQTVFNRFKAIVGQFVNRDVSLAGVIEFDESVRKSTLSREPFILKFPKSKASKQVDALVEWIVDPPEERMDSEAVGILRRMRQVFAVFKRSEEPVAEPESLDEAA